jgi:hypothetical protein
LNNPAPFIFVYIWINKGKENAWHQEANSL